MAVRRTDGGGFWNRAEAINWPTKPSDFDRRLAEVSVVFASIGRQPHVWTAPPHDEPADLVARLTANGFEDVGDGLLLVTRDADPARDADDEKAAVISRRAAGASLPPLAQRNIAIDGSAG